MKKTRIFMSVLLSALLMVVGSGCSESYTDMMTQRQIADKLVEAQPTPSDIDYSLERYNLVRRAYWVNGQREKAAAFVCPVAKPVGYVILMLEGVGVVGTYTVDGKVTSLNSYLTPDSTYYDAGGGISYWLADVDGSYGENDSGIFFFTKDGNYIEWTGTYLYSDIPFDVDGSILKGDVK